jgi:hypothetical protein
VVNALRQNPRGAATQLNVNPNPKKIEAREARSRPAERSFVLRAVRITVNGHEAAAIYLAAKAPAMRWQDFITSTVQHGR